MCASVGWRLNLQGKKILITGGAGLLGSHLAKHFLKKGASVKVIDMTARELARNLRDCMNEIEYVEGECKEKQLVQRAMQGMDIVCHQAAKVGGALYTQSHELEIGLGNLEIDRCVIEAARNERPLIFQYTSSAGVYDKTKGARIPTPESEAWRGEPDSLYGMMKLFGERLSLLVGKEIDADVAITRLFPIYGKGENYSESGRVIPHLIRKVLLKEPYIVWGDGSQLRSFLEVNDATRALVAVLEKIEETSHLVVNVGSPEAITIKDLALMISELSPYSIKAPPIFEPSKSAGSAAMVPDITLLQKLTGWTPEVPLRKGLTELFTYYQDLYGV